MTNTKQAHVFPYKVICYPPTDYGDPHEILCKSYQEAQNTVDWYINVEWELHSASAKIVANEHSI